MKTAGLVAQLIIFIGVCFLLALCTLLFLVLDGRPEKRYEVVREYTSKSVSADRRSSQTVQQPVRVTDESTDIAP